MRSANEEPQDACDAAIPYLRRAQEHVGAHAGKLLSAAASLRRKEWHAVVSRRDYMPWGGERGRLLQVTSRTNREALAKGILDAREHYERDVERLEMALGAEGETAQ